uniref:Uncharacterized protein n=1 Tax=Solanum tuberosum TaxID=4113 RepID=M1AQQ8_SOLTU
MSNLLGHVFLLEGGLLSTQQSDLLGHVFLLGGGLLSIQQTRFIIYFTMLFLTKFIRLGSIHMM